MKAGAHFMVEAQGTEGWSNEAVGPLIPKRWGRTYLTVEFVMLFVVFPTSLYFFRQAFGNRIIPSLVIFGLGCLTILLLDRRFERKKLWNTTAFRVHLGRTLKVLVPAALLVGVLYVWVEPERFLAFPKGNTQLWVMVMIFYPVFSVYPQEIIFRTFLFHRYRVLFPNVQVMIVVSGLTFGLAHLFFANWVAPVMTTIGGILFAKTYARSESTLQASIEHGFWGDFIFTIGLGWYFYGGSIT